MQFLFLAQKGNILDSEPTLAEIWYKGDSALSFNLNSVSSYGTTSVLTPEQVDYLLLQY